MFLFRVCRAQGLGYVYRGTCLGSMGVPVFGLNVCPSRCSHSSVNRLVLCACTPRMWRLGICLSIRTPSSLPLQSLKRSFFVGCFGTLDLGNSLLGLYWGYIGIMGILGCFGTLDLGNSLLGLYWGYIGVILGLYWENGNIRMLWHFRPWEFCCLGSGRERNESGAPGA